MGKGQHPVFQRLRALVVGNLEGLEEGVKRQAVFTVIACFTGAALALPFSVVAFAQGRPLLGALEVGFAALMIAIGGYIRFVRHHPAISLLGGIASAAVFLVLLSRGGAGGSGHIWSFTFPLFAMFIWGSRRGAIGSLALLIGATVIFAAGEHLPSVEDHSWDFKVRFIAAYGLILGLTYLFEHTREASQALLAERNIELERNLASLEETAAARRESETLLKATLESTGDGVFVVNNERRLLATNARFAEMWRLAPDALVPGQETEQLTRLLDDVDCSEAVLSRFREIFETQETSFDTLRFKDGRVFEHASAPLLVGGKTRGRVWSFRDVTERVEAQRDRERLQAKLQRSQKMEALGTLAGGVAHDLNNVLGGIVGYPDLLLEGLPADSPIREDLLTIRASGNTAALIVQDLLTLARRGVPSRWEVLDINEVVEAYLGSAEHRDLATFHPKARVACRLGTDLLRIEGSRLHLKKTVMNLVSNAAEAMPDGGEIEITTAHRYIDTPVLGYDAVNEGEYVLLTVSDTGVGIAAEDIDHIFEPFYTKKKMGRSGSGLGMAVVWGTVKDHDGYVDVQSSGEQGTVFTLYLPATRERATTRSVPHSVDEYSGHGESILVVDDVAEQRDLARRMLSTLGYEVTTAVSGEEALAHLEAEPADLIVLDMIMEPGIDGLETYERIVAAHPGQRAIIASGFSETDRVRRAQELGAGAYLRKPYTIERLGLAVKVELAREP